MSVVKSGRKSEPSGTVKAFKRTLIASAIGIVLFFLLMLAFSAVLLKTDTAGSALLIGVLLCAALSSLVTGFAAVRPVRKNGLILGGAAVIPLAVVMLLACMAAAGAPGANSLIAISVMLICGAVGGVAAANKRKRKLR